MALDSIGYYALPVIPSFEGIDRQVNASMRKSFGGLGKKLGLNFGQQLGDGIKSSANAVQNAARAHVAALDKVKDATGKLTAEEAKLQAARSNAASRASAVGTAERRLEQLRRTGTATDKQLAAAERAVATARERARNSAAQVAGISARVESSRRREASATRDAKRAEDELAQARNRQKPARGLAGMFGLGGSGGGSGGSGAGLAAAGGLARTAGMTVGKAFLGGLGAVLTVMSVKELADGLVGVLQESINTGLSFERQANTFQGVTRATTQEMEQMRATARALGSDTKLAGASASDASAAMTELAKGGLSVNDAMAAARGTLQLATAGQLDAAEAAKIQANALAIFSLGADQATHVADLLANAANASSADLPDLALALQQGGSAAAGFGMSIDETLSVLAAFSKMGINSSDAGTMLKTSLLAITDGGEPAQEAIGALGLQLYDLDGSITGTVGKFVGYTEMMRQVSAAAGRMTEEQFQAATATLFGSDAMRAAMIAGNKGPALFEETARALERQGGAADMAAAQMQGLPGVVEGISNVWEEVKLSIFDSVDAIAQGLGGGVIGGLEGLSGWLGDHKPEMIAFFTGIGQAATEVAIQIAMAVRDTADMLAGLVNAVGDTYGAVTKAGAKFYDLIGQDDRAKVWYAEAEKGFGLADGLYSIRDSADAAVTRMDEFNTRLGQAGTDAQNTAEMVRALGEGVKAIPTGATITVESNSPEVKQRLTELGFTIKELPDGKIEITANTQQAKDAADAWRRAEEAKRTDIPVGIDPAKAEQQLKELFGKYPMLGPAGTPFAPPPGVPPAPGGPLGALTGPPRAAGGIFAGLRAIAAFANGGRLPQDAVIQPPAGAAGLVQWAEDSTEGEAFIPLSARKRKRSRRIWAETGKRLGVLNEMAEGGIIPAIQFAAAVGDNRPYVYGGTGPGYDCSGFMSSIYAVLTGKNPGQRYFTTESDFESMGFVRGYMPGAFNIGVKRGGGGRLSHMAGTLPNGVNVESGGSHNSTLCGGDAAGANDFPLQFYLPVGGGDPTNAATYGGYGYAGAGGAGSYGYDPATGAAGTYQVDPEAVTAAQNRLADMDANIAEKQRNVAIQEAELRELKSDASESDRMRAESQAQSARDDLAKAQREKAEAQGDLAKAQRGEFVEGKGGAAAGASAEGQLGEIGSIASQFLKDTFGLGDLFPDPSQLGIVKLAQAILGIKYTPQGTGFRGGLLAGLPNAQALTDPNQGTLGLAPPGTAADAGPTGNGLPFGMIPAISSVLPTPGDGEPHMPGGPPGPPTPAQVDASTNVTINNPQGTPEQNEQRIRRTLLKTPRYGTYTSNPGVMGA